MRASEHYKLNRTQPTLDFVDVDVTDDVKLFVDPRAIIWLKSDWGRSCANLVHDFFSYVVAAIRDGKDKEAIAALRGLREPNETHLGLSVGISQGRAVGKEIALDLFEALQNSEAVKTGLVQDLDDATLLVEGVGPDLISDITTNIIREPLIEYTQAACVAYKIPMSPGVDSGLLWNPKQKRWFHKDVVLPVVDGDKLILVPKYIARRELSYNPGKYYRAYVAPALQEDELRAKSALVKLTKHGPHVTKTAIYEKYGSSKAIIVEQTLKHPDALRAYRNEKARGNPSPGHSEYLRDPDKDKPDWNTLLKNVVSLHPGREAASAYEEKVGALCEALFFPSLVGPDYQQKIHDGRKRIDVTFTNAAEFGFFRWLSKHYTCPYIYIECKNYSRDIKNPELDQLSGRFSRERGQIGLIICRSFDKKNLFLKRCRDTATDGRGFILVLDDADLVELVKSRRDLKDPTEFPLLHDQFQQLVS